MWEYKSRWEKKKPLCFPSRATYPCNPFYKVIKLLPKRWLGYLPFAGADQPFIHVQFPSSCHYCPLTWLFLFHLSACPVDVFTLVCLYLAFSPAFIGRFGLSVLSLWNLLLLFLCHVLSTAEECCALSSHMASCSRVSVLLLLHDPRITFSW